MSTPGSNCLKLTYFYMFCMNKLKRFMYIYLLECSAVIVKQFVVYTSRREAFAYCLLLAAITAISDGI